MELVIKNDSAVLNIEYKNAKATACLGVFCTGWLYSLTALVIADYAPFPVNHGSNDAMYRA